MSNVTVQEALKASIDAMTVGRGFYDALNQCKAALTEIEKCEPVGEVVPSKDDSGIIGVNWLNSRKKLMYGDLLYTSPQPIEKCEPVANQDKAVSHLWESIGRWSAYIASNGEQAELSPPSWLIDAVRKATSPQPIEKCEPLTDTYVQVVPDKCDRIVYKNRYYSLDLLTSPQPRDWVELPKNVAEYIYTNTLSAEECAKEFNEALKQLNTKG